MNVINQDPNVLEIPLTGWVGSENVGGSYRAIPFYLCKSGLCSWFDVTKFQLDHDRAYLELTKHEPKHGQAYPIVRNGYTYVHDREGKVAPLNLSGDHALRMAYRDGYRWISLSVQT